ncbi:hypothetical protein OGAPHI_005896 [Ogataea philodendri]|uniref:Vacuolar protein sorting-associated protein 27 n=1 Tax=Ogataea philodendri TaxID=1378263 RepID=A0A9P8NWS8_9ASCO|nr:uncharacterized protein OGAPHI_005896 [Ogataea philodendri]KAH3661718.1 hypothetical protein OGAPHI_005896 [Ogataea philodendri]
MSWFGRSGTATSIEEKIAEATSESIPNGDIDFSAALEISDLIRSKQVPSKDAMRGLKKRFINNKNPNLQKSSLKLIDFCIKNGGEHFLSDISSKEFIDAIVLTLNDKNLNHTVKEYLLQLIQSWSIMFSTNPKLGYVNQVYNRLQKEGFQFPMITDAFDSTLIESKVAPEWEDSDACMLCSTLFTFLNRKHHCRSCGGVFCGQHSSKTCELPELGITIPVRVCDTCYQEHKEKAKKHKRKSKNTTVLEGDDKDDDLRRAIELSLKESGVPIDTPSYSKKPDPQELPVDDDDEDMKAAIAASLADFKSQEALKSPPVEKAEVAPQPSGLYSNLLPESQSIQSYTPSYTPVPEPVVAPSQLAPKPQTIDFNAITAVEDQNIVLFAQLVQNLKNASPEKKQNIANDQVLKNLSMSINQIKPKLDHQLRQEFAKLDRFQDLYSKTFAISKVYDEILQLRAQQTQYAYQTYPPPQQYSMTSRPVYASPQIPPQYSGSPAVQYAPLPQLNNTGSEPLPSSPSQFYPASAAVPEQVALEPSAPAPQQELEKPKVQEPVNLIDL